MKWVSEKLLLELFVHLKIQTNAFYQLASIGIEQLLERATRKSIEKISMKRNVWP